MNQTSSIHKNSELEAVWNSFSIKSDMVICKRIMDPSPEQAQASLERAICLSQEYKIKKYLVDARGTLPPRAELRKTLRGLMQNLIGHFDSIAVVIDENPTMKVSAHFLFHKHEVTDQTHFELCTTIADGQRFLSRF